MLKHLKVIKLDLGTLLRILSDVFMVSLAFFASLTILMFWAIATDPTIVSGTIWKLSYGKIEDFYTLLFLVIAGPIVFLMNGFYTYGRAYQSRFKVLIIIQAVSTLYLLLAFTLFIFPGIFSSSKTVYFLSYAILVSILVASRIWSALWRSFVLKIGQDGTSTAEKPSVKSNSILVIGGSGYIGSLLVPKLLDCGYKVRVLDLMLFGDEPLENVINHPNLEIMRADFRQVDKVVEAMCDIETVVHLGGIVGDPACSIDEKLTIDINLTATLFLGEVARGHGVKRFIFASSCSVYGASNEILDERSNLNPVSLYARSKIASEKVLEELKDDTFSPVYLRFGTIYGLSGRTRFDLVVNLLTAKALVDGKITVFGRNQWRPFIHVEDVAQAVFAVVDAPLHLVANEAFNVGSNEQNFTLGQIGAMINKFVPEVELLHFETDGDERNYRVNFDKITKTLNFNTKWSIEDGIRQVIAAIKSGSIADYHDAKFSNVKSLKAEMTVDGTCKLVRLFYKDGWEHKLIKETDGLPFESK